MVLAQSSFLAGIVLVDLRARNSTQLEKSNPTRCRMWTQPLIVCNPYDESGHKKTFSRFKKCKRESVPRFQTIDSRQIVLKHVQTCEQAGMKFGLRDRVGAQQSSRARLQEREVERKPLQVPKRRFSRKPP